MDLFGDMLTDHFRKEHAADVFVEQLRPGLHARFSSLGPARHSPFAWNTDRLLNRFLDYPRWLRKRAANFDLFHIVDHSYSQLALELPFASAIITCHDLDTFRCLLEPEKEPRPRWFRIMTERILRGFLRAAHVICPSDSTRVQILRNGLFPEERVTVIPPGVHPAFAQCAQAVPDRQESSLLPAGEAYLLHVGSTIPRKRIDLLLQIFARVRQERPELKLVRVGGAFTAEQSRIAHELGLDGCIVTAPYLTETALARAYRNAALVLQTSEAEGFGLPVIEAMMCGCPVVASDIASLREAGGAAAEYCPVGDFDAWAETVLKLLEEQGARPCQWEARRGTARQHAAHFTWSRNAEQTLAVYRLVSCALTLTRGAAQ